MRRFSMGVYEQRYHHFKLERVSQFIIILRLRMKLAWIINVVSVAVQDHCG